jgi:hypothetical protein
MMKPTLPGVLVFLAISGPLVAQTDDERTLR